MAFILILTNTNIGGLIVIGMFLPQWDATESVQQFENVANKTFRAGGGKLLSRSLEIFLACIQDGKYSVSAIQEAFKATFTSEVQMFNPLRNNTKVLVTTTSAKDSVPGLFTNYNRGKRSADLGYDVVRAEKSHNDISVSEAYVFPRPDSSKINANKACCTSAVLW
jgi:hypothetical protein